MEAVATLKDVATAAEAAERKLESGDGDPSSIDSATERHLRRARRPPSPAGAALAAFLTHLPRPTLIKLVTVMYAGHGDGDFYTGCYACFANSFKGDDAGPAHKLLAKVDLADDLREGLLRAAEEGFDVEAPRWRGIPRPDDHDDGEA